MTLEAREDRVLKWCATHDAPALLYADDSKACWHDLVVETRSDDHDLVPTRAEAEVERLRAAAERVMGECREHWTPGSTRIDNAALDGLRAALDPS